MEFITIRDKWGKARKARIYKCEICKQEFIRRILTNRPNKFCSIKCRAIGQKTAKQVKCLQCKQVYDRKLSRIDGRLEFCSRKCKEGYMSEESHPNWRGGRHTYRKRAFTKYGMKCASGVDCPLFRMMDKLPSFMFEADHIDSNRQNNLINNIKVLCVWCHRLKTINTLRARSLMAK